MSSKMQGVFKNIKFESTFIEIEVNEFSSNSPFNILQA